jgi:CIC family chloride channel protein
MAGVVSNELTIALLRLSDSLAAIPSTARAAAVGAMIGAVAYFAPSLVGGGDALTQDVLSARTAVEGIGTLFLIRFVAGPLSYAAQTPGGIFAPLLLVGAAAGAAFAGGVNAVDPTLGASPIAFAIAGMAAFFAATVQSPITGIALAIEMTGQGALTLQTVAASAAALMVPLLFNSRPIYTRLRERMLKQLDD